MLNTITRWLLFATGISLPLSKVHAFDIAFLHFTVNKFVTAVLLVWAVVFWLASRRGLPKDRKLPWLAAMSVAMAISVLNSFLSGYPVSTIITFVISLAAVIFFYVLILYIVFDRRCLDLLLWGYLLGCAIASISVLGGYGLEDDRTGGLGGDPNHFSYHAVIGLAIVLMYFSVGKSVQMRGFLGALGVILVAGIMASLSRGGALAAAAVFGFWMFRMRRLDALRVFVPAGILAAAVMFLASPDWVERMASIQVGEVEELDTSSRTRLVIGEYSVRAFLNNPLFGVGFTRFGQWSLGHLRELKMTGQADVIQGSDVYLLHGYKAIHNSYLHVAAEMGLFGLIPYLALLTLSWFDYSRAWKLARRFREDPILARLYTYAIFLQIGMVGALVDNMTLASLRFKGQWLLLALSGVVLHFTLSRIRELQAAPSAESLPNVPPLPGLADGGETSPLYPAYETYPRR